MKKITTIMFLLLCYSTSGQVPSYLPTTGLKYYYPLNGNANDSSGYSLHGTSSGTVSYGVDRNGFASRCYIGTGRNGINIPNTNLPVGNHARSASVWFKSTLPYGGGSKVLLDWGNNSGLGQRFGLYTGDSSVGLEYYNASVTARFIQDSLWHNLIVTYPTSGSGSSSVKVYLDGVNQSVTIRTSTSVFNTDTGSIHTIGTLFLASSYLHSWVGSIDEVAIWDRELTACEAWVIAHDSMVVAPISGSVSICSGDSARFTNATPGGTWSTTNASVATVSRTGVVTGIAPGTDTIKYTVSTPCGTFIAERELTVSSSAPGVISGRSTLCIGDTLVLSYPTTGGSWRSMDTAIASVSALGIFTSRAAGVDTINYSVTTACGSITVWHVITVSAMPSAGSISGISTLCSGRSVSLSSSVSGGMWQSSNPAVASVTTTGVVYGITAGADSIKYSLSNSCGTNYAWMIITVITIPDTFSIVGPSSICLGDSVSLYSSRTGGSWSSATATVATVSPHRRGCWCRYRQCCYSIRYYQYMRNTHGKQNGERSFSPRCWCNYGPDTICLPGFITLADTTRGGSWSSTSNYIATVNVSGVVSGVTTGVDTILFSVTNACGTSTALKVIKVLNCIPTVVDVTDVTSDGIEIYPNHSKESISIYSPNGFSSVIIVDLTGRTIFTYGGTDHNSTIEASGLTSGLLFVKVNGNKVFKIWKE